MNPNLRARLLAKFRAISKERVERLHDGYMSFEADLTDEASLELVLRELHSLKGESRMMGFGDIHAIVHRVEDHLHRVRKGDLATHKKMHDAVLAAFDVVGRLIDEDPDKSTLDAEAYLQKLDDAVLADPDTDTVLLGEPPPPSQQEPEAEPEPPPTIQPPEADSPPTEEVSVDLQLKQRRRQETTLRVERHRLGQVTELSADLVLGQARVEVGREDIARTVSRLDARLTRLVRGFDRFRPPGAEGRAAGRFDALKTELEQLAEAMRALQGDLARVGDETFSNQVRLEELEEVVRSMRLVPIESVFVPFRRAVRDLSREQRKSVRVELVGGDVEIDKDVLDVLEEPLVHLVRNAVDHGIEGPDDRRQRGKSPEATVRLAAEQVGGGVVISVSDDGRGMDPAHIRTVAVRRGMVNREQADALSDEQALDLIFQSGFSSKTEVTELSGRGVGMAVVKERVESLGGTLRTTSTLGVGTRFALQVPISMVLQRVMLVRQGGGAYAVPMDLVAQVEVLGADAIERIGRAAFIRIGGQRVPFVPLAGALGQTWEIAEEQPVVVVRTPSLLAVAVDEFAGVIQAVHRPLDKLLDGLRLYQGAIALPSGEMALLLNTAELAGQAARITAPTALHTEQREHTVLVVDDSEFTRDMVVGVVKRMGFIVVEGVNGRQGLERFEEHLPDLVLTDLDMPVLDGFGLLLELRRHPKGKDTPVVVFSTRGSDDDKQRASRLGADAYLVKSEFREETMRATVSRFLERTE